MSNSPLSVAHAPFVFRPLNTALLYWGMIVALLPNAAMGIYIFGSRAALVIAVALATAVLATLLSDFLKKKSTVLDGSNILIGLFVAFAMPASVSLYIPIIATLFAVLVVKEIFGGSGFYWMNPSLAGIVFAMLNWPSAFKSYPVPALLSGQGGVIDALSTATSLGRIEFRPLGFGIANVVSQLDNTIFDTLASSFKLSPSFHGFFDFLLGVRAGAIGEVSLLFLVLALIIVLAVGLVRFSIPFCITLAYALLFFVTRDFTHYSEHYFLGLLTELCSGSFILVAFFIAPDPSSSPNFRSTRIFYGLLIGTLIFVFRKYSTIAEGAAVAVLLANCCTPSLDALVRRHSQAVRSYRQNPATSELGGFLRILIRRQIFIQEYCSMFFKNIGRKIAGLKGGTP